jgi:transposase-like protein
MDMVPPDLTDGVEDARKTGRTSARMTRVEVLAPAERRRSWTLEQKREIVGESLGPELTPTEVAQKYRISTGQLYAIR